MTLSQAMGNNPDSSELYLFGTYTAKLLKVQKQLYRVFMSLSDFLTSWGCHSERALQKRDNRPSIAWHRTCPRNQGHSLRNLSKKSQKYVTRQPRNTGKMKIIRSFIHWEILMEGVHSRPWGRNPIPTVPEGPPHVSMRSIQRKTYASVPNRCVEFRDVSYPGNRTGQETNTAIMRLRLPQTAWGNATEIKWWL